jgi:hypothetical protein
LYAAATIGERSCSGGFVQMAAKSSRLRHPAPPSMPTSTRVGGVLSILAVSGADSRGSPAESFTRTASDCVPSESLFVVTTMAPGPFGHGISWS